MMENGDKFFAQTAGVVQRNTERRAATQVGYTTGGAGKFAGCRGLSEHSAIVILTRLQRGPGRHRILYRQMNIQLDTRMIPAKNSKYVVSQNVDIGDAPNHIVRLYDTHITLPNNASAVNGLKLVEIWARGTGEIADGNGSTNGYFVFLGENGDKFLARTASVVQSAWGEITATTVGHITGGTGKLAGIQGVVRQVINIDPRPGGAPADGKYEIEYSIGKETQPRYNNNRE